MRDKVNTVTELSERLHEDFRVYFEFERVYGTIHEEEHRESRNAISSLIDECPFVDTIDEIVEIIYKKETCNKWNDAVYRKMLRYLKHNTVTQKEIIIPRKDCINC